MPFQTMPSTDPDSRGSKLIRIGIALSAERNRDRLLESILLEAKAFTGAVGGTLYLCTENRRLRFAIVRNDSLDVAFGGTTGNELDVAISGKGYFSVQDPNGNVFYTRNGHFHVDSQGQIVTTKGYPVLDAFGKPLTVNLNDSTITIANDGTITAASGRRGRLGVVQFPNEQDMDAVGDSMFKTTQKPTPATNVKFLSGMLESSNVEPIIELTKMVDVLRSYESSCRHTRICSAKAFSRSARPNSR